ncbi:uncharacterized protein LOC132903165 isoform X1 [Amyelois transitella]|uniref:uncharacterized protein LOC132903165 isoform X1 n=2 Tax=Amyelois transitella TaxID=680683 RepID=UPI00299076F4|nr:uncharacterized protein LOC132903165 isoform X1 [Amyelois transitella]
MAPRKAAAKPETVQAVAKGRPQKPKENKETLKTPTAIKIKVFKKNLSRSVQNLVSPNQSLLEKKSKYLTSKDKLELANKVARAQLNKSEPIVFPSQSEVQTVTKVGRKRGRKKKVEEVENVPETSNMNICPSSPVTGSTDTEDVFEQPKQKIIRKITSPVKQTLTKKTAMQLPLDPVKRGPKKRKLVSPSEGIVNPPKRKWTQSRITEMNIVVKRNSEDCDNSNKTRTVTVAKPKIVRKRTPRGKKSAENIAGVQENTPSIAAKDAPNNEPKVAVKKEDNGTFDNAGAIDSRKTSVCSELSWTKDISDSSNTTSLNAVTSSDFVLIDKKLPEVKLTKIDSKGLTPKTPSKSSLSSDSDSSESECSTNCKSYKESEIISKHSLNLSTSSESHMSPIITQKNISINTMNSNVSKISKALDKLSMSLKKIDLEMINWVGYQNEDTNVNSKKLKDKIHQSLQEESNIILQCRHINKVLTDNEDGTQTEVNNAEKADNINDSFVKPTDVVVAKNINKSAEHSGLDNGNHSRDQNDYGDRKFDLNENFASDNIAYIPFDQNDDEDALSLYAESIGFESNRNSTCSPPLYNNPEYEEYIPQSVTRDVPHNTIVYNPTKITNVTTPAPKNVPNVKPTTIVCEKQNADSTSVVREGVLGSNQIDCTEKLPDPNVSVKPAIVKKGPCLLATLFKPSPGVKSVVFKGMCFFFLIGSCKNQLRCRFPHVEPLPIDVCAKLIKLSEDVFIQEYMLLKCWPVLRRKFGICFVDECKRRDLTKLLVEMAIDFVTKANPNSQDDAELKIHVLEEALLHLNNIDLSNCEELLKYVIQGKQLCDYFMETIANTQNFTRFKPVFIKLTDFVIENQRAFSLDVATHILERVAILPFNDSLAWALISIIKHTDVVIFENSMMAQFEKQLSSNEGLHREFMMVKEMAGMSRPVVSQPYVPVAPSMMRREEMERPMSNPMYPDGVKRYTSPDTTHLDTMNKPTNEPVIKRTINFDRTFSNYNSSSSESTDDYPRTPKPSNLFASWKNKSIFNKCSAQRYRKRRTDRQVTYGGTSNFPRRPGPDFF